MSRNLFICFICFSLFYLFGFYVVVDVFLFNLMYYETRLDFSSAIIYKTVHYMAKIKTESAFVCLVCVFKNCCCFFIIQNNVL